MPLGVVKEVLFTQQGILAFTSSAFRREENEDAEFACVKISFDSLLKNDHLNGRIQEIVLDINKIHFLSYQLLNYHFTRLIQENKPSPDLKQNLFYKACSTVSVLRRRIETSI